MLIITFLGVKVAGGVFFFKHFSALKDYVLFEDTTSVFIYRWQHTVYFMFSSVSLCEHWEKPKKQNRSGMMRCILTVHKSSAFVRPCHI